MNFSQVIDWFDTRLSEATTWAGIGLLLGQFGVHLNDPTWHAVVQTGMAVAGLAAIIKKEKGNVQS